MAEFFAMGGYGFHVWTCWGVSGLLLGALAMTTLRRTKSLAEIARKIEATTEDDATET
jgi:heme exporter protein CcmD